MSCLTLLFAGCNSSDNDDPLVSDGVIPEILNQNQPEDVIITIGNLSDLAGTTANAVEAINVALADVVRYFNNANLIPGIKLAVVTYDGQYDPSKDISGYHWLRERGADLIVTTTQAAAITLAPMVSEDKIMLYTAIADTEALEPPCYVFSLGSYNKHTIYTLLKWIAETD